MTDDDRWVTVAAFTDALEANIARGRLEAEGVEAMLAHEHHVWANWLYSIALGGVKVQVRAQDTPRAREVIERLHAGEYALPDEEDPACCPRCGSSDIAERRATWRLAFVSLFAFDLPLPFRRGSRCRRCGHTW